MRLNYGELRRNRWNPSPGEVNGNFNIDVNGAKMSLK